MIKEISLEDWLLLLIGGFFFLWGIAVLLFGHVSLKYLDEQLNQEGISPPEWDKGIGARGIMYAMVIVANKAAKASPIDDEALLRYVRKVDRLLALYYLISFIAFIITLFSWGILYGS